AGAAGERPEGAIDAGRQAHRRGRQRPHEAGDDRVTAKLSAPLPELLEQLYVEGHAPHLCDPTGVDAVEGELLRADGAAGRFDAVETAAVRSRVREVRRDPRRVDLEVAQLPAVIGERADDRSQRLGVRV